ncbi:MAG TPA: tryptophan halogenase family protein [Steroidobacteraceae bacterium]|nr:tryptophan halogenase family protein [Steroidobacteraceae bacterium]
MTAQTVKKVVIAGGGTSGWCAAAALSKQMGTLLDITLIESEEIGTVGVGEATFPTVRTFHKIIDIDEREFLRVTRGSIKLGISYENWARIGDRYIHSFGVIGKSTWLADFHHLWVAAKAAGFGDELGDYCFEHQAARAHKFFTSPESQINYAYHFDATLYARFLRTRSEAMGVRRVEGKIGSVVQNSASGDIEALVMESGQRIEGDLFIDCTGFRGLLIEQTLKAGYEDWTRWLRNDSALAVQTNYPLDNIPPYTRAIAQHSGWQWKIPLQHRQGTGIVYSSAYTTDEEVRKLLLGNLEGDIRVEPRLLKFKSGRRRSTWVKNCIALGLSAGFVEPLESTSIHLVQSGITRLLRLFPISGCGESLARQYNQETQLENERVRDFIVLHYKATERDDTPYWRDCRDMEIPDTLTNRLELYRESALVIPDAADVFRVDSWLQVLTGQRVEPRSHHHIAHLMDKERLRTMLSTVRRSIGAAVEKLPTHKQFLDSYCLEPDEARKVTGAK